MKPTTLSIPSVLLSVRHIHVKDRVYARWLDFVPSTLEYLRSSTSATRTLRDWSHPKTTYKHTFAAELLKPRFLIADVTKAPTFRR